MLCKGCGFTNSNDASFCSMCGVVLMPTAGRQAALGTIPCPSCSSLNEDVAVFCRACGARIAVAVAAEVPAMAAVGAASSVDGFMSLLDPLERERPAAAAIDVDGQSAATRHESLLAKLDRMEQDISSRLSETLPTYEIEEPEPDLAQWDAREDNLASLSTTLDGLIADLLDAEINEYLTPDFIHPDETGFPSPDPAAYAPKPQKQERRVIRVIDVLVIIALIVAVFLVGMTVGLWGSYALGF